jgi:hypothetical protein
VRPWPDLDSRRREQVSQGGGILPVWSRNPEETVLHFISTSRSGSDNVTMMRASFSADTNDNLRPDPPEPLFTVNAFASASLFRSPYDVALDGRFLMVTRIAEDDPTASTSEIVIVRNFVETLKERVPAVTGTD